MPEQFTSEPQPDDPDEIARDLRALLSWDCPDWKCATELELAIAAALRAYGASQRNAGLEEVLTYLAAKVTVAKEIEVNPGELKDEHDDAWMVGQIARTDAEHIRSLKSKPEAAA